MCKWQEYNEEVFIALLVAIDRRCVMDEDLYDEFGNYIGPELAEGSGSASSSDSEDDSRVRVQEPEPGHDDDAMDIDERTSLLWPVDFQALVLPLALCSHSQSLLRSRFRYYFLIFGIFLPWAVRWPSERSHKASTESCSFLLPCYSSSVMRLVSILSHFIFK